MTRHTLIFVSTFIGGALIALVARAALYSPHANHADHGATGAAEYAPMVSNALTPVSTAKNDPHAGHGKKDPNAGAAKKDPHAGHAAKPAPSGNDKKAAKTVNTVCPICGMDVDPSLQPAEYKGKLVGFGCRACPPRFKKDPERWGPYALRNEVRE
jgi:YHS domain-containing protein